MHYKRFSKYDNLSAVTAKILRDNPACKEIA